MRLFVGLVIGAVGLVGGSAHAGSLARADLSLEIGSLPPMSYLARDATGATTSNLGATLGAGTAFNGTFTTTTVALPDPLTKIVLEITKNDAGSFEGTAPGGVGGDAKFGGVARISGIGNPLFTIPLGFGAPGTTDGEGAGVAFTAINAPWTAGVAEITGTNPVIRTGWNGLTPGGIGVLQLVTPVKIQSNIGATLTAFAVLDLTYTTPEPALPVMLSVGAATLVVLGARRRR
jgi:hypothetical protein